MKKMLIAGLVLLTAIPVFASMLTQDFEGTTFPPSGWSLAGAANMYSRTTTCSGYGTGTASAKCDFYNTSAGSTQDLITIGLYPAVATDSLKFDHAYATYATEVDSLKIYTSTNGGSSWTLLIGLAGGTAGALRTAPATTAEFVPTAAQWATKRYTLPAGTNKIRFTARSAYGNQLYLDNIKISYPNLLHDASVTAINAPKGALPGKVAVAPQVVVKNTGISTETFNTTCKISVSGGAEVYNQTLGVTNLAAGGTQTLTYANWTPDSGECYNVTAHTSLTGDLFAANDTAKAVVTTYFSTNKVMVEMFTATSCPPCVAGNDSLNKILIDLKNYCSVIRTHVWWPTNNDPYYLGRGTDSMENRARVTYYGVSGVPASFIGGTTSANLNTTRAAINSQRTASQPMTIALYGWYNPAADSGVVVAKVTGTGRMPSGTKAALTLRYAIVEDSSYYTGTNGDPRHDQVLRDMLPNNTGVTINMDKGLTVTDSQKFKTRPAGGIPYQWTESNCYAVVYVQNNTTKEIYQSANAKIQALAPLAVELSEFTAMAGNGAITLNWQTASETDNYQWLIERSTFPDNGFAQIAVLDAANSPNGQSYSYSDNTASPLTDYYYRLGDKDMSGNVVWNGPILVTSRGEVITSVSLAPSRPNPCSQGAKIAYALPKAGNVSLNVYDVTGCLVRTLESGVKNAGSHQAVWDLKNNSGLKVSNGIYLYRLTACNQTRTQKLTVIR
jgi:thiol-disulfide isomerase/thioredoxin